MYKSNISPVHFLTLLFNILAKTVSCAQIQYQPYVLFNPVSSNIRENQSDSMRTIKLLFVQVDAYMFRSAP
jgi:hypothetical protein